MKAWVVRDSNGVLKCFYKASPTRHILRGTWESKPVCKREYFIIPPEDAREYETLQWWDDPREVRLLITNRRILWR